MPEYHLKAVLRFPRRQVRNWWLLSDYKLDFGDQVYY
jgi:hypothetical protein